MNINKTTAALAMATMTAFGASGATSDSFGVDPLNQTIETISLDQFNGVGTLTKATITINWQFSNLVEGLGEPLADFSQTGLTNQDANSADADLNSTVFADVAGVGGAIDGSGVTQTSVQTLATGQHFDFDAEDPADLGGSIVIMFTGADLAAFTGAGTFDVELAIDGGWDVIQTGQGGQGSVNAIFDSVIAGEVSVEYDTTVIPTPSAAIAGLVGLGGLATRRRRK